MDPHYSWSLQACGLSCILLGAVSPPSDFSIKRLLEQISVPISALPISLPTAPSCPQSPAFELGLPTILIALPVCLPLSALPAPSYSLDSAEIHLLGEVLLTTLSKLGSHPPILYHFTSVSFHSQNFPWLFMFTWFCICLSSVLSRK